jgi:hypothetical protein
MTITAGLPSPSPEFSRCRSLIGSDTAHQFAAFLRQTNRRPDRFNHRLDHPSQLQTMLTQITTRGTCPTTQSASLKSP